MDTNTFYAVTSGVCFTLVGLWWTVVKDRPDWFKEETTSRMAAGVYASFLIPALMSLGAQIGGDIGLIWQGVFVIASLIGVVFSTKLIKSVRLYNSKGPFSRNSWFVPIVYGFVLLFSIFPRLAISITGLQPLQVEGILLCFLLLAAYILAWEFLAVSGARRQ